jgi:hypothetical protein
VCFRFNGFMNKAKYCCIGLVLLFLHFGATAQYGHEWIRPYQPYYKLKVVNTGVYRLDSALLASTGVLLSGIHSKRFQLYRNGVEQMIYVAGQNDGIFNQQDYIEFFGERNDGKLDSQLYVQSSDQPHQFASLFNDTAVYFLTILPDTSIVVAKRFTQSVSDNFASFTSEAYFNHDVSIFPTNEYVDGINLNPGGEKYNSSEYTDGEGWADFRIGLGDAKTYVFNTPNYALAGGLPSIEAKVIGVSDYVFGNPPNNHHVRLSVAKFETQAFTTVTDIVYKGYVSRKYSGTLNSSDFGSAKTLVKMDIVNDLAVASDFNCLSYIKLSYPRLYNLNGLSFQELMVLHTQGGIRSRLSLNGYGSGQTHPYAYDFTSGQRVAGFMNGGIAELLITNTGKPHHVYVFDSTDAINITQLQPVTFNHINPANQYDFVIVTNPLLNEAAFNYEQYRAQQYRVLKVYADELYDYYTYGQFHPLAIKRLAAHLINTAPQKPQFLALLGKGYQGNLLKKSGYYSRNLVPAIGVPASDVMFTSSIVGTGFTNDIPTGRIPAATNDELQHYLNKLIDYETKPDSILPWRKNVLHISGGNDLSQQTLFKNQLAQNAQIIKGKNVGANVIAYNKDNSESVSIDIKQQLIKTINSGVTMLTFLGHGSASILDVDFGGINDMNNVDKYTFFYFNGCNIGNPSDEDPSSTPDLYAKDFICADQKGAIGWLAHSNLTLDGKLYAQMNGFYNQFSILHYGAPIGNIIKANGEALTSSDIQLKSHSLQLTLLGDPAMKVYSPTKTDYAIENASLYISPANANAQLDSISIGIICTNLGKASDDTIAVSLTNVLPNNVRFNYTSQFPGAIYYKDTLLIKIPVFKTQAVGNNSFEVSIDPQQKLTEISRLNNSAQFSYYLPGNGVKNLIPAESSIVTEDTVTLVIQNNDLRISAIEYVFEMDTTPFFNSPLLQQSGVITSGALCKWKVTLTAPDQTVYFWRSRINVDENKGGLWDTSSFTLIRNGQKGWQQTHLGQYRHLSSLTDMAINLGQGPVFEFVDNFKEVVVKEARWDHSNGGVFDPYYNNPQVGSCIGSGVVVVKFNGISFDKDEVDGFPFNCSPGPPVYQFYAYDTKTQGGQDAFVALIDSAKNGDYFAVYSQYDAGIPGWSQSMRDALSKIGSVKAAAATSFYTCFVLIGQKGESPGLAVEDTMSSLPTDSIVMITVRRVLEGKWYKGNIVSERIGPVVSWDSVDCSFSSLENAGSDRVYLTLIAQNKQGKDTIVIHQTSQLNHSLAFLDAQQYPFVRLQISFLDSVYRTPNQFGKWRVTYQPAAEGTMNTQREFVFYKEQIDQGDSLQITFSFDNISDVAFDSLPVSFSIVDANRQVKYSSAESGQRLEGNDFTIINRKIPTNNLSGINTLNIAVNGNQNIPELDLINNYLSLGFNVKEDHSSPVLDVTFDGYRIMNGDFVSPTPVIKLMSKDDNQFKLQDDTSTFILFLKRPGNFDYERIPMSSPKVIFKPATTANNAASIEYKPERLTDGKYSIKVQSMDASGNIAGSNSYEIDFSVLNESTITNFFPYPNPGTTNIKFVFTLTGSKAPDQLLIRIMTISGKVVKEITQNEFGPIKIGNNVSEYGWDGTDNYGDRLANGVYLYQVMTKLDGQAIKKRDTSADQYVTHNTGKIYLLK